MIPEMRNDICAVMRGMVDGASPNRIYRDVWRDAGRETSGDA